MTEPDAYGRRRPRDICTGGAQRPSAAERALLERLEELRAVMDEYEELLYWARRLGVALPADRRP